MYLQGAVTRDGADAVVQGRTRSHRRRLQRVHQRKVLITIGAPKRRLCYANWLLQMGKAIGKKAKQLRARSWYSYYCTDSCSAEACRSKWRRMRLDTARADMRGLEEAIESLVPRIEERFHSAEQLDSFADKLDLKVQEFFEREQRSPPPSRHNCLAAPRGGC